MRAYEVGDKLNIQRKTTTASPPEYDEFQRNLIQRYSRLRLYNEY